MNMTKWISVKDKLPEKEEEIYMCGRFYDSKEKCIIYESGYYCGDNEWYIKSSACHADATYGYEGITIGYEKNEERSYPNTQYLMVSHWMLPEAPEEE